MDLERLVNLINDAFFRFESYAEGTKTSYNYFGFEENFLKLFVELEKEINYNEINSKLLDDYYRLMDIIRVDYDKGKFKNKEVYDDDEFVMDCEDIYRLTWDHVEKFLIFPEATPDPKFSIRDIINSRIAQNYGNNQPNSFPRIFSNEKSFRIFKALHLIYQDELNTVVANYSSIFYAMKRDNLVICGGSEFIRFLSANFEIDLDRIDSRQADTMPRGSSYQNILDSTL